MSKMLLCRAQIYLRAARRKILNLIFFRGCGKLFQEKFDNGHDDVGLDGRQVDDEQVVAFRSAFAEMFRLFFRKEQFASVVQELCVIDFSGHSVHFQKFERIFHEMHIQTFSVRALCQTAAARRDEFGFGHGAAVNGAAVQFHPVFVYVQSVFGAAVKIPARGRPHVHQQVSADTYGIDQHLNEHFGRFPGAFVAIISPRSRKSLAGFPCHEFARLGVFQPRHGLVLFGRPDILFDFGAVVDDDVGADAARRFDQFLRFPRVFSFSLHPFFCPSGLFGVRKIEPENVDFSVVC